MRGILLNGYVISEEELAPVRQFVNESELQDFDELAELDWIHTTSTNKWDWVNDKGVYPATDGRGSHVSLELWAFIESLHEKRWGKKP